MPPFPTLQSLSTDLAAAVLHAERSVVAIHARRRIPASGVLWRDGLVIAAQHTIRREHDITVTLHGGRSVSATLIGRDAGTDLALLRLAEPIPAPHPLQSDPAVAVGQLVLAVGRPGPSATAALGLVAEVGGEWRTWPGGVIDRLIRLDLTVQDGYSGSGLFDAEGRWIGVNTSGLARAAAITIPGATVTRIATQLLEGGAVARGYLGCAMQPVRVPPSAVAAHALPSAVGLLIVSIETASPADAAGLLVGDIVVSLAGTHVHDPMDVLAIMNATRAGTTITARLVRGGEVTERPVVLGERPRGRR
jgi:S1-C subfamily serine protease